MTDDLRRKNHRRPEKASDLAHEHQQRTTTASEGRVLPVFLPRLLLSVAPRFVHSNGSADSFQPLSEGQSPAIIHHGADNLSWLQLLNHSSDRCKSLPLARTVILSSSAQHASLYSSTVPQHAMRMDPPAPVTSRTSTPPPQVELLFLARLHALLSMVGRFGNVVGWTSCGTAWKINCWTQFCSIILPLFVGESTSEHSVHFFELMNQWGFQQRELTLGDGCGNSGRFEDRVAFYHDYFLRDFPSLLCVLKPAPLPAQQQERIQQPISSRTAGTTLHEDASLPLLPSSRLAPRTAQHRFTSSSTGSKTSNPLQRSKQALIMVSTGTSTKCPPTSSKAQQELVNSATKQRPNESTTAHGSARARQIRTTPSSVHQQQRGRFLSRASSSVTSRLPAKKRMSEPLLDEDTDRHQQVVPVTKKTRKIKSTQGMRRKWLPPLGPPVVTAGAAAGATSNGVVISGSTSSHGGTATTAETWYCTNAETFADFASINNAHVSHF